jgi:hypothetical protein
MIVIYSRFYYTPIVVKNPLPNSAFVAIDSSTDFTNASQNILNGINLSAVKYDLKVSRLNFKELAKVLQVAFTNRSGVKNIGVFPAIPAPDFLTVPSFCYLNFVLFSHLLTPLFNG